MGKTSPGSLKGKKKEEGLREAALTTKTNKAIFQVVSCTVWMVHTQCTINFSATEDRATSTTTTIRKNNSFHTITFGWHIRT